MFFIIGDWRLHFMPFRWGSALTVKKTFINFVETDRFYYFIHLTIRKEKTAMPHKCIIKCDNLLNDTILPGETKSGKSTLLNLILGEQLLPYSILSKASTICELRYGTTPKLVAHFKDKDPQTGLKIMTVPLGQCKGTSQQSYLDKISSFLHVQTHREKGFCYKKIELFWPHSLLKVGNE